MTDQFGASVTHGWTHTSANTTVADGAVADYSRDVHGKLAVVRPDAHRDDADLAGHRPTDLTPASRAA